MITTTLFGGLGNQMFIYAMVRALSCRNHVPMAFNLKRGFQYDFQFHRNLELNNFNVSLPTSTLSTFDCAGGRCIKKASSIIKRNVLLPQYKYIEEEKSIHGAKPYHFQEEFISKSLKNVYLDGYWQSPKYFEDCADVIREDFKITANIPNETIEELNFLKSQNRPLVMVGVRRYQEVKHTSFLTEHVCDVQYYKQAMKLITEKISNPLFVIFSQDRKWVVDNIAEGYDVYQVKEKTGELSAVSDMYLMKQCDAAIISNSTFYWWGAWLSNSKTVISNNNFINKDCNCKEWIVI